MNTKTRTGPAPRAEIDLHLAVAATVSPRGQVWSDTELAEFCGCHHSLIQQVQASAFRKLRLSPSLKKLFGEMLRDVPRDTRRRRRAVSSDSIRLRHASRHYDGKISTEAVAFRPRQEIAA